MGTRLEERKWSVETLSRPNRIEIRLTWFFWNKEQQKTLATVTYQQTTEELSLADFDALNRAAEVLVLKADTAILTGEYGT